MLLIKKRVSDIFKRRNFSLVARYSLKFTRCLLLVVKSLVTSCKTGSLLVAKKSLVTRCRSCSFQKITPYFTRGKIRALLVAEIARWKISLVIRCKIRLLLVAEIASCKKSLVTRCKIHSLLVAVVESFFAMLLKRMFPAQVFFC